MRRYHVKIFFPSEFVEEVETFLKKRKPFRLTKHALEKVSRFPTWKQRQILDVIGGINSGALKKYECFEIYKSTNGLEKVCIRVPFDGRFAVFVLAKNGAVVTFYTCADDHDTLNASLYEIS
jgi:hypothetical protein